MRDQDITAVRDPVLAALVQRSLLWLPEHGVGVFPVTARDESVYDASYWEKYEAYAASEMGRQLTDARVQLVERHLLKEESVVDVGIGCGQFVEALGDRGFAAFGYDVNPRAIAWLQGHGWWRNPYATDVDAATFWDVLEHLKDPGSLLIHVRRLVFVSIPIFRDGAHVLQSKHYRKTEHRWYFTRDGLIAWMRGHGFRCLEHDTRESLIGREDIGSFVFGRVEDPE